MKKITHRDIKFALLGFFCYFTLNLVLDWKENLAAFKDGYNSGKSNFTEVKDQ